MADKGMRMLEVACRKCIARLIAEHGRDDGGRLAQLIAADCPRVQRSSSSDIYERCGVYFPELPKWF